MNQEINSVEVFEIGGEPEFLVPEPASETSVSKEKQFANQLIDRKTKLNLNDEAYLTPKQRRVLKKSLKLKKSKKLGDKKIRI